MHGAAAPCHPLKLLIPEKLFNSGYETMALPYPKSCSFNNWLKSSTGAATAS